MTQAEMQARNPQKIGDGVLLPAAEGCHDDFLRRYFGTHDCADCGLWKQALCNALYRFVTESARAAFARPTRLQQRTDDSGNLDGG
jgi:hypothetical protein